MTQDRLRPFHAMDILRRAQAREARGEAVFHLELGEPAAAPAPSVLAAVRKALETPQRYTAAKGDPGLRLKLAAHYRSHYGVEVDPERILVTMGSSSGFILAFLAGFSPGARIAVTRPGYPAYLNILASLGMAAVDIALSADSGWRLTAADVEAAHAREPFSGLLFASPANPTGAVIDRAELAEILAACARLGVTPISDEIYHGLNFTGVDSTALETSEAAIVVNSFSKYYCMTGWRVGWLVLPPSLTRRAEMMAQSLFISAPSLSQAAARKALDERAYYDARRDEYAENRRLIADGLARLGLHAAPADGAFYAYADASRHSNDTMDLCTRLLAETGVAATPGVDFDRVDGHHFVRFSYAGDRQVVKAALERMAGFLG